MNEKVDNLFKIADNIKFSAALRDFVFKPGLRRDYSKEIELLPPLVEAVMQVTIFDTNVQISGIWKYIVEYGDHFDKLQRICVTLGASRALEYLGSVKACFPNHKIPEDEDVRMDCCDELELTLRKVDKKYAGANAEALDHLRQHLMDNKHKFEQQVTEFWEKYG